MTSPTYDYTTIHHLKKTIEITDLHGPPTIQLLLKAEKGIEEMSGKLGVFPSSFNPLTVSHEELIERAATDFTMDEVLLVLDKKTLDKVHFGATLEDRLLMLLIYCEKRPKLSVGLSSHGRFVDKIAALRKIYPEKTDIRFIVGFDTIIRILDKKYYEDRERSLDGLFGQCSFLATNRGDRSIDDICDLFKREENRAYARRVETFIISDFLASVSSTQVRDSIRRGESIHERVPPEIDRFISETGLYKPGRTIGGRSSYDLRSQTMQHVYALNPEGSSDVQLKKILRIARSETALGNETRRVIALAGEKIPGRPRSAVPTRLDGNFDVVTPLFSLEEARNEASRCLRCEHPPCELHCLPGMPILELLNLVSQRKFEQAYLRMREAEPLSGLTEYLCQTKENYCERHCLSGALFGEGNEIAIQTVFRTLWEEGRRTYRNDHFSTEKLHASLCAWRAERIAVVGSGPAGLKAAMELAGLGYGVTLFERRERIGGIPRYEIPYFRFPAVEVFSEIEKDLRRQPIEIVTGVTVGQDGTIDEFKRQGFAAVFVATGLTAPKKLGLPGEDAEGIDTSIDIFHRFVRSGPEELRMKLNGRRGYVIDSGNTAMDTSRLLRRFGAEVTCIFWKDAPRALAKEIAAAQAEGVSFLFSARPVEFIEDDGGVLSCVRVIRTEYDHRTGAWKPIPGTQEDLSADFCVYAIGANPDFKLEGMNCNGEGHILVNPQTMQTSIPIFFAGGDAVERGNISTAIRDGMKAARSIHSMLFEGRE